MELNEAARRILRGHWLIVLTCVLLGTSGGFLIQGTDAKFCARPGAASPPIVLSIKSCTVYAAAARLQIDTEEARSANEAETIVAAARAIATGPSHVAAALARTDALRNPSLVASYGVKVSAVGVSGISDLSVTDRDPKIAAALANALASDVIQTRTEIHRAEFNRHMADIDAAVTERTNRIADIDKQLEDLTKVAAPPAGSPTTRVDPITILELHRADLNNERTALLQQRLNIIANDITRPKAAILEPALPPTAPESSHRAAFMGLGFLLGLILGVGIAALLESFRPTIIGGQSVARALGAPTLGHLIGSPQRLQSLDFTLLGARLRLAAHAARVGTIELVPADPSLDVSRLAEHLQNQLGPAPSRDAAAEPGDGRFLPVVRPLGASGPVPDSSSSASGLVVVAPDTLKKTQLAPIGDVLTITNWPVLGVITYPRPRFWGDWGGNGSSMLGGGPSWRLPKASRSPHEEAATKALRDAALTKAVEPEPTEGRSPHDEDRKGA